MANCIAYARGMDKSGHVEVVQRLGSVAAEGEAATQRTSALALVEADGGGKVIVKRDGKVIHFHEFGPEEEVKT